VEFVRGNYRNRVYFRGTIEHFPDTSIKFPDLPAFPKGPGPADIHVRHGGNLRPRPGETLVVIIRHTTGADDTNL
jgi:hypothetical protein